MVRHGAFALKYCSLAKDLADIAHFSVLLFIRWANHFTQARLTKKEGNVDDEDVDAVVATDDEEEEVDDDDDDESSEAAFTNEIHTTLLCSRIRSL